MIIFNQFRLKFIIDAIINNHNVFIFIIFNQKFISINLYLVQGYFK